MHEEWEGGRRHGVAWRRLITGTVIVGVLVASWTALRSEQGLTVQTDRNPSAGVSEEPDVVLQPPARAGSRWVCAADHPVRAYDGGLYYPPEHPGVPPDIARPAGCFMSSAWAESGGYELAPAPPDAMIVGSLYLVPAVAPSFEGCAAVAAVVDFDVPCPQRLPAPGRASSCMNSCLFYGAAADPGVVIEQRGFLLPSQWCDDCADHVVIAAVKDRSPAELVTCGPAMAEAAAAGDALRGYHDCPPGPEWLPGIAGFPHERHTMLVWEEGRMTYAISMEGHSARIRTLLSTLKGGLAFVEHGGR